MKINLYLGAAAPDVTVHPQKTVGKVPETAFEMYQASGSSRSFGQWEPTPEQQAFLDRKFKASTGRG
jgi:hypothetical protein